MWYMQFVYSTFISVLSFSEFVLSVTELNKPHKAGFAVVLIAIEDQSLVFSFNVHSCIVGKD